MTRRSWFLMFAVMFAGVAACLAADDPNLGTWKLDEGKSKIAAGLPKNTTVVYAAAGDSVKVTLDGVGADGKPTHSEWTGKYDGKDYPVSDDSSVDARSIKQINARTLEVTNKKDGKITLVARVEVSADGKSRTVTVSGKDAKGNAVTSVSVYNKQ